MPDGSPSNVEDQKVVATVENDSRRPLAVASPAPPKNGMVKIMQTKSPVEVFRLLLMFLDFW